jgi:hypothetical protein
VKAKIFFEGCCDWIQQTINPEWFAIQQTRYGK